ncbi:MAG: hypothetical protein ABJF01_06765 [bacterium]
MKRSIAPLMFGVLVLASGVARVAGAQVGYTPSTSPYLDLEHSQELTLIAGPYHSQKDPAGVGPQNGTLIGAHYEWRAGGPAHLVGEFARISSDRRVVNPFKVGAARELGVESRPLYSADFNLGLSLTGGKSWHHLVPEVAGGMGFISDLKSQADSGGFKFGTRFAISYGAGIRIVPGGRWQVRADVKNRMYTIGYPEAFYTAPAGGTALVGPNQAKSFWTSNPAFTLGLSRLF